MVQDNVKHLRTYMTILHHGNSFDIAIFSKLCIIKGQKHFANIVIKTGLFICTEDIKIVTFIINIT